MESNSEMMPPPRDSHDASIDSLASTQVDSDGILQRLVQIRAYLAQASTMRDQLIQQPPVQPVNDSQVAKLNGLISHLKEQEAGYVNLLSQVWGSHTSQNSRDDESVTDTVSINLEQQSELSTVCSPEYSRPLIEDKLGYSETLLSPAGQNASGAMLELEELKKQHNLLEKLVNQQKQLKLLKQRQSELDAVRNDAVQPQSSRRNPDNDLVNEIAVLRQKVNQLKLEQNEAQSASYSSSEMLTTSSLLQLQENIKQMEQKKNLIASVLDQLSSKQEFQTDLMSRDHSRNHHNLPSINGESREHRPDEVQISPTAEGDSILFNLQSPMDSIRNSVNGLNERSSSNDMLNQLLESEQKIKKLTEVKNRLNQLRKLVNTYETVAASRRSANSDIEASEDGLSNTSNVEEEPYGAVGGSNNQVATLFSVSEKMKKIQNAKLKVQKLQDLLNSVQSDPYMDMPVDLMELNNLLNDDVTENETTSPTKQSEKFKQEKNIREEQYKQIVLAQKSELEHLLSEREQLQREHDELSRLKQQRSQAEGSVEQATAAMANSSRLNNKNARKVEGSNTSNAQQQQQQSTSSARMAWTRDSARDSQKDTHNKDQMRFGDGQSEESLRSDPLGRSTGATYGGSRDSPLALLQNLATDNESPDQENVEYELASSSEEATYTVDDSEEGDMSTVKLMPDNRKTDNRITANRNPPNSWNRMSRQRKQENLSFIDAAVDRTSTSTNSNVNDASSLQANISELRQQVSGMSNVLNTLVSNNQAPAQWQDRSSLNSSHVTTQSLPPQGPSSLPQAMYHNTSFDEMTRNMDTLIKQQMMMQMSTAYNQLLWQQNAFHNYVQQQNPVQSLPPHGLVAPPPPPPLMPPASSVGMTPTTSEVTSSQMRYNNESPAPLPPFTSNPFLSSSWPMQQPQPPLSQQCEPTSSQSHLLSHSTPAGGIPRLFDANKSSSINTDIVSTPRSLDPSTSNSKPAIGSKSKASFSKSPRNECFRPGLSAGISGAGYTEVAGSSSAEEPQAVCEKESSSSEANLFNTLRDTIYAEVARLISAHESRPHFLIELFRELQLLKSDYLRQRALFAIQELISRFIHEDKSGNFNTPFSPSKLPPWVVDGEDYATPSEQSHSSSLIRDARRQATKKLLMGSLPNNCDYAEEVYSASEFSTPSTQNAFSKDHLQETAIHLDISKPKQEINRSKLSSCTESDSSMPDVSPSKIDTLQLDREIKHIMTDVIPLLKHRMDQVCSQRFLSTLRRQIMQLASRQYQGAEEFIRFFHQELGSILGETLSRFSGKRLRDCGEDLLVDVSEVLFNELAFFRLMRNLDTSVGLDDADMYDQEQIRTESENTESGEIDSSLVSAKIEEERDAIEAEMLSNARDDSLALGTSNGLKQGTLYNQSQHILWPNDGESSPDQIANVPLSMSETKALVSYGSGEDDADDYDAEDDDADELTSTVVQDARPETAFSLNDIKNTALQVINGNEECNPTGDITEEILSTMPDLNLVGAGEEAPIPK